MSGGGIVMDDDVGSSLIFLIILLSSIDEDQVSLCNLENFRKDGIYVQYNEIGGVSINHNEESGNGIGGIGFSTTKITPTLYICIG